MSYIIIWRSGTRDAFIQTDDHGFVETYDDFETAKKDAETIEEDENRTSPSDHYYRYKIYEEVNS